MVVSTLEHCAHRCCRHTWQLAIPSPSLDHAAHHPGNFGLVDVVSGACACRLQQARDLLNAALNVLAALPLSIELYRVQSEMEPRWDPRQRRGIG